MSTENLPPQMWDRFQDMYAAMSQHDIRKLVRLGRQELQGRFVARKLEKVRAIEGYRALSNFMAGVTWALACRAALRKSKGHEGFGKRPAAGNMWLPRELLYAVRHQVRDLGWHPITAENVGVVIGNMLSHASTAKHEADRLAKGKLDDYGKVPDIEAVKFRIPFAKQTGVARFPVDHKFDFGGGS